MLLSQFELWSVVCFSHMFEVPSTKERLLGEGIERETCHPLTRKEEGICVIETRDCLNFWGDLIIFSIGFALVYLTKRVDGRMKLRISGYVGDPIGKGIISWGLIVIGDFFNYSL